MALNQEDSATIIAALREIVAKANNILIRANDDIADATAIKAECNKIMTDIRD